MTRLEQTVTWEDSGDARLPYKADVAGARWQVRLNEFPEEEFLYALLVDDEVVEEFMDWPAAWAKPAAPLTTPTKPVVDADDAYERGVYEHEMAKLEHQKGIQPSKLVK